MNARNKYRKFLFILEMKVHGFVQRKKLPYNDGDRRLNGYNFRNFLYVLKLIILLEIYDSIINLSFNNTLLGFRQDTLCTYLSKCYPNDLDTFIISLLCFLINLVRTKN